MPPTVPYREVEDNVLDYIHHLGFGITPEVLGLAAEKFGELMASYRGCS